MTMRLRFVEPPLRALSRQTASAGFYFDVAEALQEAAGKWAVLPREFGSESSARSAAGNIRRGVVRAMPKGQFEAVVDVEGDKPVVYVRFVGEGGEHAHPHTEAPIDLDREVDTAVLRQWARDQGIELAERGRIPADVRSRYLREQQQREEEAEAG